ncbi:MAG TPA: DUF1549 domain-containing protein [Planctomycetota bacterium]|nr:DUF1549 domain-containing protein [Planctomycetota bacterium]
MLLAITLSAFLQGSEAPSLGLDFTNVVLPILTRSGCNAASCHGAALGQGGFRLSLFGNDPEADHAAITRDLSGRRIDRAERSMSLVLRKPSRQLPHKGGRVLPADGENYRTLRAWAEGGFPFRENDLRLVRLDVRGTEQLTVNAVYSDGIARDVTHVALFSSNDDGIADVTPEGAVTLRGSGETAIMVRFGGHVAAQRVSRSFAAEGERKPAGGLPLKGFIDAHIGRALERIGLEASGEARDDVFLRRVFLDVIGTLPSSGEARAFLEKPDRNRLIEDLIARPEFDAYWGYRLDQLFGVGSKRLGGKEAAAFHAWLRGRVRKPWAGTANAVLTASGFEPETGFYRLTGDPKELSENTGRIFLGARWQCAQCHDHPFERFRQTDYFGLAAMLARVRQTDSGIVHFPRGEVTFPKTGRDAVPVLPDGTPGEIENDRRPMLAGWVTSQPQFRQAFANRVWALIMGRGLVHPADDFRASNPPALPDLLEDLSRLETLPELVGAIARSAAYQRAGAAEWNRADDRFYSHFRPKALDAEVLVDAIAAATGIPDAYQGRPPGTRAIEIGDFTVPSYTLDVCGRNRPGFEGSLSQTLHLLNGDAVQPKLAAVEPLLLHDDSRLVEELYLRTLSRLPSKPEAEHWAHVLEAGPRGEAAEDLLWALLNSREFTTCH